MSEKSEALRLADALDECKYVDVYRCKQAAAELRRLLAENERLHQINQSHEMKLSVRGYEIQIADLEAQRDALLEQRDELRRALEIIAVGDATNPQAQAAEELTALGYWKATAHEAQKHSNAELKLYEGEKG